MRVDAVVLWVIGEIYVLFNEGGVVVWSRNGSCNHGQGHGGENAGDGGSEVIAITTPFSLGGA